MQLDFPMAMPPRAEMTEDNRVTFKDALRNKMWDRILYPVTNTLLTAYRFMVNTLKPFLRSSPTMTFKEQKWLETLHENPYVLKIEIDSIGERQCKCKIWILKESLRKGMKYFLLKKKKKQRVLPTSVYWKGNNDHPSCDICK